MHSNRLFLWRLRRWFRAQAKHGSAPQVVFARHIKLAAALLDAMPELPLIYEAHEVFARPAPKLFALEKKVLERSTVVIAITYALAEALRHHFTVEREFVVLPSATALPENTWHKNWSAAGREIVYAGSFFDWKGVDDLVAAGRWLPGCCITLVGGDEKGSVRLRTLLSKDGADVVFAGHLPHREVWDRLGRACIAVLPNRAGSVSEFTSPLKLFEYMAAGCAVVASDLPVFREVLAEEDASWFIAGDPKDLARAILRLIDDPERARAQGQELALKARQFTWPARAERLAKIVEEARRVRVIS